MSNILIEILGFSLDDPKEPFPLCNYLLSLAFPIYRLQLCFPIPESPRWKEMCVCVVVGGCSCRLLEK